MDRETGIRKGEKGVRLVGTPVSVPRADTSSAGGLPGAGCVLGSSPVLMVLQQMDTDSKVTAVERSKWSSIQEMLKTLPGAQEPCVSFTVPLLQ